MRKLPIIGVEQKQGGTQLKLIVTFDDGGTLFYSSLSRTRSPAGSPWLALFVVQSPIPTLFGGHPCSWLLASRFSHVGRRQELGSALPLSWRCRASFVLLALSVALSDLVSLAFEDGCMETALGGS